jgi:hypothetical protein
MSDFVEQCRSEWKRLGVPDPLAEEMAADLASDLREAEAEGVSAEELLGSSYFDPRSFAASWAAERGVVPTPGRGNARRRPFVLVAFTALAALMLVVAALLLATGEPKVSLVTTRAAAPRVAPLPPGPVVPPGVSRHVVLQSSASAPVEWILLLLAIVALGFAAWLWSGWGRSRPPAAPA